MFWLPFALHALGEPPEYLSIEELPLVALGGSSLFGGMLLRAAETRWVWFSFLKFHPHGLQTPFDSPNSLAASGEWMGFELRYVGLQILDRLPGREQAGHFQLIDDGLANPKSLNPPTEQQR
jgi:hypothetical protein